MTLAQFISIIRYLPYLRDDVDFEDAGEANAVLHFFDALLEVWANLGPWL